MNVLGHRDELPRVFVRDIEPDPGYEFRVFDLGEEIAIEPGTWLELVSAEQLQGAVSAWLATEDAVQALRDGLARAALPNAAPRVIEAVQRALIEAAGGQ